MRTFKMMALAAVAVPGLALAQVGPNPAVNGSLDPTIGRTGDTLTAPNDAPILPGGPEGDALAPAPDNASSISDPNDATAENPETKASAPEAAAKVKKMTAPTSESKRKPR